MKKSKMAAIAAVFTLALSGCGAENGNTSDTTVSQDTGVYTEISSDASETEITEPSADMSAEISGDASCADIISAVSSAVELPSMADIGADRVSMYLNLKIPENCDFAMSICGSGGFADEVFIIDTNDSDITVDDVKSAAEKRIDSRKKDFEGYNPDEFDKLDNYITIEKNGYLMYAVTVDNSTCERIFNDYVK